MAPAGAGPWPLVVYIHGGGWAQGSRTAMHDTIEMHAPFEKLARAGFAVAPVSYRLSSEAPFPAQLHDVKAAVRWLRVNASEFDINPGRIAVWGESAGGHLACLLALTAGNRELEGEVDNASAPSAVQAVVDWYGPTDLLAMDTQSAADSVIVHDAPDSPESRLIGAPLQGAPDLARRASPISYVRGQAPPFLIVHGDKDRFVPVAQSIELAEALRRAGTDVTLHRIPGADHIFIGYRDIQGLLDEIIAFLRQKLA